MTETAPQIVAHRRIESSAHVELACEAALPALLVCDHASNHVPESLAGLGVSAADRATHIGWDIGAAAVAEALGQRLRLPVILATHSRLLIDCNRRLDDVSAFPVSSGGIPVPGNQRLSAAEQQARAERYYWPYHHAVRDRLQALEALAPAPALVAIHSFTPTLDGAQRPWHFGVLWDKDSRIAKPLLAALRASGEFVVGDNEPYSGRHPADFTLDHHAEGEGRPHVGIEIRQDLIKSAAGVSHIVDLLGPALRAVLGEPNLYTLRSGTV